MLKKITPTCIHHQPIVVRNNFEVLDVEKTKVDLKQKYEFIYDNLGEETLNRWYIEFDEKYKKL